MKKSIIAVVILALSLVAMPLLANTVIVTVTKCHDGDTCTVLNENNVAENIRIYRADSPEEAYVFGNVHVGYQPYANEARDALIKLCVGKPAIIVRKGTSYQRTVATMSCDSQDVALYQVTNGNAWAYRYASNKQFRTAMSSAKAAGLGLWALPNPIEPWAWRKNRMH